MILLKENEHVLAGKTKKYIIICIIYAIISFIVFSLFSIIIPIVIENLKNGYPYDNIYTLAFIIFALLPLLIVFLITFTVFEIKRQEIIATYTDTEIIIKNKIHIKRSDIIDAKVRIAPILIPFFKYSYGSVILITKTKRYKLARIEDVQSVYDKVLELLL